MSSPSLPDIQCEFWQALSGANSSIFESILSDEKFVATDRVNVYRETAKSLHISVLASVYTACNKILGEDYFKLIAKHYYANYPSTSPNLNDYGEQFPSYLSMLLNYRYELKDFSYLSELAKLEWCIQKSHYSRDDKQLDIVEFQQQFDLYGGEVKFYLVSSIELLATCYPVTEIWQLHQQDNNIDKVNVSEQLAYICIYRDGYEVKLEKIEHHVYKLMMAVIRNESLSVIAEHFPSSEVLNAALVFVMSKQWLRV